MPEESLPGAPPNAPSPLTLRFRVAGFPVAVEPTFWVVSLIGLPAGLASALLYAAVSFVSILVHELGHAMAARRFGGSARIRLYLLGGLTYHSALPKARQRILVSLAGPGAGFALGLLALAVYSQLPPSAPSLVWGVTRALLWVSFVWGFVNLLPVPPLDGGHVFEEAVGPKHKLLAAQVGAIVAVAAALEGLRRWGLFAAVMFGVLASRCFTTWLRLAAERRLQRQVARLREKMWEDALASDDVGVAHQGTLRETMRSLRETARAPAPPGPKPEVDQERDPALLARVFDELGLPDRAAEHALEAHRRDPSDANALQAVRLLLSAGRRPEAESLVTRTPWSAEATRAEASALLQRQSPSPTRSRG